ncbi:ribosomal protein L15 [Caldisphaera lagunensis DSM 15908]|uniref:Large ribosomal subunit protein uL15 n=1 Tax=Caldisphaera lagunensis (strain DSM 15908 / JCM 11604 / ANMR 0165 / IC-154) TaxID=1056495 RepID=L0ACL8_CALLD|nr:uL15 family ribosomal protein [Caldisphaera lagunensis]AFZ70892.1 ribosomal protein L15 [Caldisphaera lagunensis DSM 15908]
MALTSRSRKKSRKLRGRTRSMGWGRVGQHRKSGSKGGTGGSGMNKHRKTWMLKYYPNWFGAKGFVPIRNRLLHKKNTITLRELDQIAFKLRNTNVEGDKVVLNLNEMGYDKLVANGKIYEKVKVIVKEATKKAIERVKEAGGEVIVEKIEEEEQS